VTVAIPMAGRAESLNAAVAAAVVLYVTWAAEN
jgi:tRNA G18 (ribose-2'-O)-methylase SpoU